MKNNTSRQLLILLMIAHFLGTIIAYTVYIKIASLGDGYLPESFPEAMRQGLYGSEFGRTMLVHGIYYYFDFFLPGLLTPIALGQIVAIATWLAFRDVYSQVNRQLFWICNLFPHFLVWSGASSKEQLVILSGLIVLNFAVKRSFATKNLSISLIFVFLAMCVLFIIRPNYFVIYFVIFTTAFFSPWLQKIVSRRLSVGVYVIIFSLSVIGVTVYLSLTSTFFSTDVVDFMMRVESYFLSLEGGSNRYGIQWKDIYDFLYNSVWAIPQGFIGPTLIEGISKPVQFPAFLEGLLFVLVLGYLFFKLLKLAIKNRALRVYILPYIFACFVIVFISYPYLMFNPGSALRYKQSMHPILIFYPLLI